jgi:hypothetical protein
MVDCPGSVTAPDAKIYYSNLTATRLEGMENMEIMEKKARLTPNI